MADGSSAKGCGDLWRAVNIRGQGMVGYRVIARGRVCGEELSAGGPSEWIKPSLATKVIRVVRLSGDGGG